MPSPRVIGIALSLLAAVAAQQHADMSAPVDQVGPGTSFRRDIDITVTSLDERLAALERGAATADLAAATTRLRDEIQMATVLDRLAAVESQVSAMAAQMSAQQAATSTFATITRTLEAMLERSAGCSGQGKFLNTTSGLCVGFATIVLGRSSARSCSIAGQIKVNPDTDMVEVCASGRVSAGFRSPLPLVYQSGGTSTDSTDNGWLDRGVAFTKRLSATYIRVTWSDTARLHDWGASSANYRLMICDARSNNCLGCTDPGELRVGRYVHQHGDGWNNDYHPFAFTGICRRRGGTLMGPGAYRIRAHVRGGNSHFGLDGMRWTMLVDEVYKA